MMILITTCTSLEEICDKLEAITKKNKKARVLVPNKEENKQAPNKEEK